MDAKTKAEQIDKIYRDKSGSTAITDVLSILMFMSVLVEIIKLFIAWKCPAEKITNRGLLGAMAGARVKRLLRHKIMESNPEKIDQLDLMVESFWQGINESPDDDLLKIYTEQGGVV